MLSINGFLLLLMFVAGGLAASQSAINAQLSNYIGNPIQASFISFCVGAAVLAVLLLATRQGLPGLAKFSKLPPQYLLGGLCGSIFITCAIFLVPRIGVVNVLFLGLAGQMIVSVAIDSFGLFGLKSQPLTSFKLFGLLLIVAGVAFLKHESTATTQHAAKSLETASANCSRAAGQLNAAADTWGTSSQNRVPSSTCGLADRVDEYHKRRVQKRIASDLRRRLAAVNNLS